MKIQEMFNKAVRGLRKQKFERSITVGGRCMYDDGNGKRCAWGHVDPKGTRGASGSVYGLNDRAVGVAAMLTHKQLVFASRLQNAHDLHAQPEDMKEALRCLAKKYRLKGAPK